MLRPETALSQPAMESAVDSKAEEGYVVVTLNGHKVELHKGKDSRNVDIVSTVLQNDSKRTMFVSIKGRDCWYLVRFMEFKNSTEYDVITTPISQPLKKFIVHADFEERITAEEYADIREAWPCFQEVVFPYSSIDSEQVGEGYAVVVLNGHKVELFEGPDSRNLDIISGVLQNDSKRTMLVSVKGHGCWSLVRLNKFENSREYDIITTPISQPVKKLILDTYLEKKDIKIEE
eukprot:TRINITY_DN2865_c0_g1_i6.p1 TRINITY_DN2865_c0_g1~~TRINITY_DN2865_c0_g1_i6.p1  ORF type:complete len:233 (-),score=45.39 TRINITY_DN2865_c0_g1_i6:1074-1772(-)